MALSQVNRLHLLPALFSTILVPTAVDEELATGRSCGHDVPVISSIRWITVRSPVARPALPDAHLLGRGESEVLWLALEVKDCLALIDESPARRVASQLGIAFTGTLGLLLDAKHLGLVGTVATILDELERHDFRMSARLRQLVLKRAGEVE
jgi:predicted nucleic acid-binding protein